MTDVARLKAGDGPDLSIWGSSVLIQTLFGHDLIDEIHLLVYPVVLGSGKRFFRDGAKATALKLERSTATPSGIVMNSYRPDGAIRTGSFAHQQPSEAEMARRERWRREG